ncbi:tyrosine-type recombinase/integrase [Streptomyces albidus (ex Kaewkla and Franco 2022)]|uniref:tyrosine-type recombinase/integrase n=1 Tax=Streptomyces albidus (ex Kaewkla and Franco 2022) TaxID=722709 RepID=UPI001B354DB4|nr:tyrosine-type recombinase/integrase [Streptomyces albidus (ex Kaewkla and Franco 2022)]
MTKTTPAEPPEDDGDQSEKRRRRAGRRKGPPDPSALRDGVKKRGSTWSYVIRIYDPSIGKTRPTWVGGFQTEDEAKAARDEARVKARNGLYVNRSTITVGEFLAEWLDVHAAEVKPRTLDGYRWLIERYVLPHMGKARLQSVRPATITRFYLQLQENGGKNGRSLSARTVGHVHAVLRKAFRDAVHIDQLLASNPVERAKRPRRERRGPGDMWTKTQLRTFLHHASQHRMGTFFHLAAYTGARRGELLFLRWSAVDFDRREVAIRGSAGYISGRRIEGSTKTGRSRTVSIDRTTIEVMKQHRAMQDVEREKLGMSPTEPDDLVFANEAGEPLHPDTVSSLMAKLITSFNAQPDGEPPVSPLPRARLHDLRHLHATTLLMAKVPVHVVAMRLGHQDPSITLRVYAHVIVDRSVDIADLFERELRPGDEDEC